jgi:hypothetical protein
MNTQLVGHLGKGIDHRFEGADLAVMADDPVGGREADFLQLGIGVLTAQQLGPFA